MGEPAGGADLAPSLAGRRLGRYEVLTQLASGGMAAVYVARAQGVAGFERLVAIKVLHPHIAHEQEFISMFLDEARLAARIRHPNVVATLDISDTHGAGYFLVMDYIEGDHLGAMLKATVQQQRRLPVPVTVRILHDALSGLSAAHSLTDERGEPLQLVHRDISPHNIMVGKDGIARLTDFGVAKAEVRLSSTREGQFKGKLSYMAPEHASTGQADQRSDLFSMGIVLWECLTGQRLFRADNNAQTLNKILHDPIPTVSSILPELEPFDPVLDRALARPPAERFQSADDFMEALEEAARSSVGVGSTRQVANVVKQLIGPKLAAEHQRIRKSIEDLGHSDLGEVLLPLPVEGSGSHVSMPKAIHDPEAATRSARPDHLAAARRQGSRRSGMWAAAIVLLLLIAGAAAYAFWNGGIASEGPETLASPPRSVGTGEAEGPSGVEPLAQEPDPAAAEGEAEAAAVPAEDEGQAGDSQTEGDDTGREPLADEPQTETGETGDTGEADDGEAAQRRAEAERRERLERIRRARRERETSMMTSSMGSPEDDLLGNPYRR